MVFDKKPLQVRTETETREFYTKLGNTRFRIILEEVKNCYSPDINFNIALLKDELNILKNKRDTLQNENNSYEKLINENNKSIQKFSKSIQEKNEELREYMDKLDNHKKQITFMYNEIKKLIEANTLNEISVNEILENKQDIKLNHLIDSLIIEFEKSNDSENIINILENCKIKGY